MFSDAACAGRADVSLRSTAVRTGHWLLLGKPTREPTSQEGNHEARSPITASIIGLA